MTISVLMSTRKHVTFTSETEASALLNNNDIVEEFSSDSPTFVIKFRRYVINKRAKTPMIEVILTNDTNHIDIFKIDFKTNEVATKLLSTSNEMNKSIREMLYSDPDAPFVAQDKSRLRAICMEVLTEWEVKTVQQSMNAGGMPDFDAKLPIAIPLFGFTINEEEKEYLTEGFWAIMDGSPELFTYISSLNEDGDMVYEIVPFFHTDKYHFDVDILAPEFSQEWLVSPSVFKRRDEPLSDTIASEMFDQLYNTIIPNHIWISDVGQRKALAYWILATYFYDMFDAFPIGHGWGFYGSGKSRMGMLIVALAYHAQFAINMSNADLFRTKEEFKPTMVIDENEENTHEVTTIKDDMINGSYVRGAGSVSRRREVETANGKIYVRQTFELYSPTFFCSINPMRSPASRSRTITFPMVKKDVKVPIAERRSYKEFADLMFEFRFKRWSDVRSKYIELNELGIDDSIKARDHELWLPIFTMMEICGRTKTDKNDVLKFANWNRMYKQDTDMSEEERPTLYAAIAKLWYEATEGDFGYTGSENKDKDKNGMIWYDHPSKVEHMWEFRIEDLATTMKAIATEIGFKKDINAITVGKSISMLGFEKNKTSNRRKATFIFNMNMFENIVKDHMDTDVLKLATREYDSNQALVAAKENQDMSAVWKETGKGKLFKKF